MIFKMGYCISDMREDLYRQTTTEESTDANGNTTTETKEVSYHPLGFYLCKGIFLDINHNLYIDVAHLTGLTDSTDYKLIKKEEGLLGSYTKTTQRTGNQITTRYNTLLGSSTDKVEISDQKIILYPQCLLCMPDEILIDNNQLVYRSTGALKTLTERKIKQTDYGFLVPNIFGDFEYTNEDNTLTLDRYFDVTWHDGYVEFRTSKWSSYYWVKTSNGYVWQSKHRNPIVIEISPNKLVITRNYRQKTTYTF
jgi:hypothetical protein